MNDIQQFLTELPLNLPPSLSTRSSTSSASVFPEDGSSTSEIDIALGLVCTPGPFDTLNPEMANNYGYNFPLDHVSTSPNYSDVAKSPQVPLKRFSESSALIQPNTYSLLSHQHPQLHYESVPPPVTLAPPHYPPQEAYWPPSSHQHPPASLQHQPVTLDTSWSPTFEPHPASSSSALSLSYPNPQNFSMMEHSTGLMPAPELYHKYNGYAPQSRLSSMTQEQLLTFKAGYEMGLSQNSSISEQSSSSRGPQSTFSQYRRSSKRLSRASSGSSIPTTSSISGPPSPTKPQISRGSSYAAIPENEAAKPDVECNPDVPNEYMWLVLPKVTQEFKDEVLRLAIDKRLKSAGNEQIPDVDTVSSILDSFSQSHLSLKLTIMNALYGAPNNTDLHRTIRLPKMTTREMDHYVEVLIQTSNGLDLARPDFINTALTGLRNCTVLRNQLCKTRVDVLTNTDKRPHNSWFLYRGAQMNRASILKITECLPNDYNALLAMKEALFYGIGVTDKEAYISHLKKKYLDPHDVKADLTALGYVVAYMWNLESYDVKKKLTEFSRVEHAHKLKVFPYYRYAPKKPRKRASSS